MSGTVQYDTRDINEADKINTHLQRSAAQLDGLPRIEHKILCDLHQRNDGHTLGEMFGIFETA